MISVGQWAQDVSLPDFRLACETSDIHVADDFQSIHSK